MNVYVFFSLIVLANGELTPFEEATRHPAFVDKTNLIRDFINRGESVIMLFTPSGFGRTTNIDMLKQFLGFTYDFKNSCLSDPEQENVYKLFTDYKLDLAVMQDRSFFQEHFASYPVIHFDFSDCDGSNVDQIIASMVRSVQRAFNEYYWMNPHVDENRCFNYAEELKIFWKGQDGNLNEDELTKSINAIAALVHGYFHMKVIVLIDEFDAPIMKVKDSGIGLRRLFSIIDKMLVMAFEDNFHVRNALITGTTRVARAGNTTVFDNVKELYFLDEHEFSCYFGFLQEELYVLYYRLNNTRYQMSADDIRYIDTNYRSYNTRYNMTPIYNPYDVLNYVLTKELQPYWVRCTDIYGHEAFSNFTTIHRKLKYLSNHKEVEFQVVNRTTINEVGHFLKYPFDQSTQLNIGRLRLADLFFTYLLDCGWLTYTAQPNVFEVLNQAVEEKLMRYVNA